MAFQAITGGVVASLVLLAACLAPECEVPVPGGINRIVSLSPSLTRQVVDLGAGSLIVGVTSHDDFSRGGCALVGTLVRPNIEMIVSLDPDLVLFSDEDGPVQKLEMMKRAGVAFRRFGRNRGFGEMCGTYIALGALLGREDLARARVAVYRERLDAVMRLTRGRQARPVTAFFLSWRPLIAASADSFIGGIIRDAGGTPAYAGAGIPYPLVTMESLVSLDPEVIICMTGEEDLRDFTRALSDFGAMKAVAGRRIRLVDPDVVPYYTPRDYVAAVETVSAILDGEGRGMMKEATP